MTTNNNQLSNVSLSQNEDSKLARNLFSKTAKLEKDLALALRRKSPVDKGITQLRLEIRSTYESIIFLDIIFAASKDIDQLLWKCVFYREIEEFRKIIKKYHSSTEDTRAKEKLHKICSSFLEFLDEAIKYYENLYLKLETKYNQVKQTEGAYKQCKLFVTSLHKCLIILGDLARYVQLYNEQNTKDWSIATKHYTKALELIPSNGNPHNQLAVLATYQNDDCEAIYRYFRSLSVKKPFISARENLTLLFEKNRQKFIKQMSSIQQSSSTNFARRKKKKYYKEVIRNNEDILDRFLVSFIRLHGVLFTKTSVETFDEILNSTVKDFEECISLLSETMVLKLVIMNIFSIDNASKSDSHVILQNSVVLAYNVFSVIIGQSLHRNGEYSNLGSIVCFLHYIKIHRDVISGFKNESTTMFSNLAAFLNGLSETNSDFNNKEVMDYSDAVLPEDVELSGFLPVQESKSSPQVTVNVSKAAMLFTIRVKRIRKIVEDLIADSNFSLGYENNRFTNKSSEQAIEKQNIANEEAITGAENEFINTYEEFNEEEEEAIQEDYGHVPEENNAELTADNLDEQQAEAFVTSDLFVEEEEEGGEEDEVFLFKPEHQPLNQQESSVAKGNIIERPFQSSTGTHQNFVSPPISQAQPWNAALHNLMQTDKKAEAQSYHSLFSSGSAGLFIGSNIQNSGSMNGNQKLGVENTWATYNPSPYNGKVIERPFTPQYQSGNYSAALETKNSTTGVRVIESPFQPPGFYGWGSSSYNYSPVPPSQTARPTMDILMNSSPKIPSTSNATKGEASKLFSYPTINNGASEQTNTRIRNPFT